jgi:chemotaxis-related protein WspD
LKNVVKQHINCWKTTGVWGQEKPRCPKLTQVIHCRNCEVFTKAGRNLLERELSTESMQEWTRVLAAKKEEESIGTLAVVIFRLASEWLALPAAIFAEIIPLAPTHTIPQRHSSVLLGIVNVHGEIQLCVSLRALLGIETDPEQNREQRRTYKRMIVINRAEERWVFPVDEIHGIYRIHPHQLQNVPVTVSKSEPAFTKGLFPWKDKYVAFLDDELLLYKLNRGMQ